MNRQPNKKAVRPNLLHGRPPFFKQTALSAAFVGATILAFATSATTGVFNVPLTKSNGWEQLTFSSIEANQVSFSDQGMQIDVNRSASPLIYPFDTAVKPGEISLTLQFEGDIQLADKQQGEKGADDFIFRLGLVVEGDQTLNFMQRAVAASWIKKLYSMAPDGAGIDKIQFYNVYSDDRLAGKSRVHPLSDLMVEHFIAARPQDGRLQLTFTPELDSPVLALWLSIDGDDTKSSYSVRVEEISLQTS